MDHVDRRFLLTAIVYLTAGVVMGISMGIAQDFSLAHVHAHINLLGWVTFSVYALAHRAWPAMRRSRLAPLQFWLAMIGTPVFLVGLPFAMFEGEPAGAILGSLTVLASIVVFGAMAWRSVLASEPKDKAQQQAVAGLVPGPRGA